MADAALLGLAAYFLVSVIRALPPFRGWVARQVKPWACDLCMSFWSTLVVSGAAILGGQMAADAVAVGAAGGVCLGLLSALGKRDLPPPFPTFDEVTDDRDMAGGRRRPAAPE